MKKLDVFCERINDVALSIASALFSVSFLMTVLQVFTRYILRFSFPWTEELSRYMMIFVVFLASGYLLRNNENPYVEVFVEKASDRKRYWIKFCIYTLITVFLIFLFANGVLAVFKAMNKKTPSLRIYWAIPYISIPVGAFLMLLQMPYLFVKNHRDLWHTDSSRTGDVETRGEP